MMDQADRDVGLGLPVSQRVHAMARFVSDAAAVASSEALTDLLVEVTAGVLDADSVEVVRGHRPPARPRRLRDAGQSADGDLDQAVRRTNLLGGGAHLVGTAEAAIPWRGEVRENATTEDARGPSACRGTTHALRVPIMSLGEVWGELTLARLSRAFSDADQDAATIFAALASTGLVRIAGDRRLRELAYTDPLTGLANRRAADEQLEAWATHPTDSLRLTVVLCDVNGLKTVNDTHGHLVGDRLITQVGVYVATAALRLPQGVAARIGGDEFLIASPCRDQTLVHTVIDELADCVAQLPYGAGSRVAQPGPESSSGPRHHRSHWCAP